MKQLQIEHAQWIARKYPGQSPKMPAIGCVEEAGELLHAVLKVQLVNTWGEDSRHKLAELRVKLADAIGDCGIFACSLCNANGWDFEGLWEYAQYLIRDGADLIDETIDLVGIAVQVARNPNDVGRLSAYLARLKLVAYILGIDAGSAVLATWLKVKER